MNLTNILKNPRYNTIMALLITVVSLLILFNFLNILNASQEQKQEITGRVIQPFIEKTSGERFFAFMIFTTIFSIIFVGTKLYVSLQEY